MPDNTFNPQTLFDIQGLTAVITGGSGHLGRAMAQGLAQAGARVAIISLHAETSGKVADAIRADGGQTIGVACDVLDRASLERTRELVTENFGPIDILINAAGGNSPQATTSADASFFDLDVRAIESVLDLNFTGTLQSCQVFGRHMANFTQWLAVHMAQEYSSQIRVNAIAPGFILTEQNRFLLTDAQSGAMTERGQSIIAHTPAGRLGTPEDLIGTLLWLVSPASTFVTGVVIPIDGGFSAYSGV